MDILTIGLVLLLLWYLCKTGIIETYLADNISALVRIYPQPNLKGSARNVIRIGNSDPSLLPFVAQSLTVKKGYKLILFSQPGFTGESMTFVDDVLDLTGIPIFKANGNKAGSYIVDELKNKVALDFNRYTNADSGGGDIRCFSNGEPLDTCKALCADDPNCVGYNSISPSFGGGWAKGGCCYKSNADNLTPPDAVKYIDWYSNISPAVRPNLNGIASTELGPETMMTTIWGTNVFVDKDAKWIWNTSAAGTVSGAPAYDVLNFANNFWNGQGPFQALLHIVVDNVAEVYHNGKFIQKVAGGWNDPNYPKIPLFLASGNNLIEIVAVNLGGAAGLKVALVRDSDKAVLLKSDSTWKVSTSMTHTSKSTPWASEQGGNTLSLANHDVACPASQSLSGFRLVRKGDGNYHEEYDCMSSSTFGATSNLATPLNDAGNGNSVYLDRHNVDCGEGKVMNQWRLLGANNKMQIQYKCLEAPGLKDCEVLSTPFNDEGQGKIWYLDRHNVSCPPAKVLTGHKVVRAGNGKFHYEYKCCGVPTATGAKKGDWEFCSTNAECANSCCSSKYSDDGKLKCTPGGC